MDGIGLKGLINLSRVFDDVIVEKGKETGGVSNTYRVRILPTAGASSLLRSFHFSFRGLCYPFLNEVEALSPVDFLQRILVLFPNLTKLHI